jgi:RNA polymerase sigma-70 factor (ECF subfamily)
VRPAPAVERSDAELVAMAVAREPRAATYIWDRYSSTVRGVLCRAVGPHSDIDDLLQEVFVGFFRNVASLREPSALKSFLIGIALRTARTSLRKRRVRRWLRLTDAGDVPDVASPTEDPRAKEATRRLYAVLDGIDDRDRLAFILRYGEGYELTEAAEALGCSLATIKRCIARAEKTVLERSKKDDLLSTYVDEKEVRDGST